MATPTQRAETAGGAALSRFDIQSEPQLPEPHRLRLYVLGLPGKGKTSFVMSMPDTLVIDPEDSACFVQNPKAHRIVPKSGEEFDQLINTLVRDKARIPYKHIVIDTVERLVPFMIPYLTDRLNKTLTSKVDDIRAFGKGGAGWGKLNEYVVDEVSRRLYVAGYGFTAVGHFAEVTVTGGSGQPRTVLRPQINDGIRGPLLRESQYIVRIRSATVKTMVEQKGAKGTVMRVPQTSEKYIADLTSLDSDDTMTQMVKARLRDLMPGTIDITGFDGYQKFANAYLEACRKSKEATK